MTTPLGRFGAIPITLLRRAGDPAIDWLPDLLTATFHFLGGNANETQVLGQGRLRLAALVRLADRETFAAFLALLGTTQTLRVPWTATAYPGDRSGQAANELYTEWDNVLLTMPEPEVLPRLGGAVDVAVVFERDAAP